MPSRRTLACLALAAACAAATASCTLPGGRASGSPSPAAVSPASPVPSYVFSPAPTASLSPSGASASATASVGGTPAGTPTPSGPVVRVATGQQRAVVLADAASRGAWVQGGYRPVNSSGPVEALAEPVACGAQGDALTFRVQAPSGTLSLSLAQALDSPSSSERLAVQVLADGRVTQTVEFGFRDAIDVKVPLAGVSEVGLRVTNPGPCSGTAVALVTRAVVAG